jgi:hypothetical protein
LCGSHTGAAWVVLGMIFLVIVTLLVYRGAQENTGVFPYQSAPIQHAARKRRETTSINRTSGTREGPPHSPVERPRNPARRVSSMLGPYPPINRPVPASAGTRN